ncbi:MAG: DNA-3-methyladenine glycosylase [Phycisphaerales bacterium]|nr:DNA-3-methyladenine glycosylase [Phycisphaerales bacterium]MCB9840064.1 DNA-3-methyladenine glycosylase [Phycisphaeraceae bacterium]
MSSRSISRTFFARSADAVAPSLLGLILRRTLPDGRVLAGRIVEAEAYLGPEDRASHAFNSRRTPRNEAMYARPGTCYVYFTYGMHFMCNVACLREGHPAAVLIRAIEPLEGLDAIREARPAITRDRGLCNGPGKLCQALRIDRDLNAIDLTSDPRLAIVEPRNTEPVVAADIGVSARIGVDPAGEPSAGAPLRWFLRGSPHVSPGRPSGSPAPPSPLKSKQNRLARPIQTPDNRFGGRRRTERPHGRPDR